VVPSQRPALRAAERQGLVGLLPVQRQGAPVAWDQGLREVDAKKATAERRPNSFHHGWMR